MLQRMRAPGLLSLTTLSLIPLGSPWSLGSEGKKRSLPTAGDFSFPYLSGPQVCDSCNWTPSNAFSLSSVPPTTTLRASLAWWKGSARPLDLGSSSLMMSPTMASPACRPWLVSSWVPASRPYDSFQGLLSSPLMPFFHPKATCLFKYCPHPEPPCLVWSAPVIRHLPCP